MKERVMAARGSLATPTPVIVWSDGIHYVRPASLRDKHVMRWVVGAHKGTASKLSRHAATLEDATAIAQRATAAWVVKHPADTDAIIIQESTVSPTSSKVVLPKFATTHFNCIRANPTAQVWQCVSFPGERAAVGRKKASGAPASQAAFNHTKGTCAVLIGRDPVREADGSVRVFPSWQMAEDYSYDLYVNTPEDERLPWVEDGTVVARTLNIDILFDPQVNGEKRPFSLFYPKFNKPILAGYRKKHYRTKPQMASGGDYMPGTTDERAALDFNMRLAALVEDETNRVLSLEIVKFESIWGAEEYALNVTEPTIRGERIIL